MSEEWCREKLANLQIKDRQLNTLNEIREHLTLLSASASVSPCNVEEVSSLSTNFLTVSTLYDCIDDHAQPHFDLACDILSMCMTNLSINNNSNYIDYLERCLYHNSDNVKLIALKEIDRILKHTDDTSAVTTTTTLSNIFTMKIIIGIIKCLELEIGAYSIELLTKILPKTTKTIDEQNYKIHLEKIWNQTSDTIVKCRLYELAVKLTKQSSELFEKMKFLLEKLINELDSNDFLLHINILTLLADLGTVPHGLQYLENTGILLKITKNAEALNENPLANLLIPGYMKFFGTIAYINPKKIILESPTMINALFDMITQNDVNILPVAFDTLGQLAQTTEGKISLEFTYNLKIKQTFNVLGKAIHNFPTPLKVRALEALELVFRTDVIPPNNQVSVITENWYNGLTDTYGLTFILEFCRNPFPDIKVAGLCLLKSICSYKWGQEALNNTAGFIEYLLDRSVEFDRNTLHEKFNVIKILADSSVFNPTAIDELNKYLSQGIFYVQGVLEVAAEGS